MARVFTAVETSLGRTVVIKVLSPELAAGVSSRRFAREIRLVASLQQANIVPVLASGEIGGLPYYTMPFVEGLALRDRLSASGALPIAEAVGILRDVARALAYAHERGVVHRDIKPENVLLSGDAAVVADFGIAKAISDARSSEEATEHTTTVTQAGTVIGTPAYMAPEQIAADPGIDHRADLYSFGCVAYELLAGETPFASRPGHQMLAHISERPAPLREKRADCPLPLAQLVMRCLEKDPAARPQSARDVSARARWRDELGLRADPSSSHAARGRRGWSAIVAAVIAIAVIAARDGAARELAVAVLPFATLGTDSAQYVADGLADELATSLGKLQGIRVVSRTLSYRYTGRDVDAGEVGRTLSADYVLYGNVRRVGEQLRVSAQLTSCRGQSRVLVGELSTRFDQRLRDADRDYARDCGSAAREARSWRSRHQRSGDGQLRNAGCPSL